MWPISMLLVTAVWGGISPTALASTQDYCMANDDELFANFATRAPYSVADSNLDATPVKLEGKSFIFQQSNDLPLEGHFINSYVSCARPIWGLRTTGRPTHIVMCESAFSNLESKRTESQKLSSNRTDSNLVTPLLKKRPSFVLVYHTHCYLIPLQWSKIHNGCIEGFF